MSYDFSSLSPADFEDLARDLAGKHFRCRFEAFCPGPDGGIDGRHARGKRITILQAKHYSGSPYATLKTAIKRELKSIRRLKPSRYILLTSKGLTPHNKDELANLVRLAARYRPHIFGREDINGLLNDFPETEKAHLKLWLSSSAVLERVLRSAAHTFTKISKADVDEKVKVYAQNPSFKEGRDKLEQTHVLIISGPPGVGKTTLAEMLSYAYVGEDWEFIAIRNLDDGFASIVDTKKQIFFFDDFLGKVALDERALASKDSELAKFIRRIQKSPNARFVLTTRAYIFEEARRASEYLADNRLNILKYVLDVGIYTRRIRARILYNHLHVFETPQSYIRALLRGSILPKIIDHPNYNPRIIEWMTDVLNVRNMHPKDYARTFMKSLDDPSQIWDTAFRNHIPTKCQHLLFALFFCPEYGVEIEDLKVAFDPLHAAMCKKYRRAYHAKDFAEALRILEGSFVAINDGKVMFINPSVRDYLTGYLTDPALLATFAPTAQSVRWADELWTHYKIIKGAEADEIAKFATRFAKVAQRFCKFPVWKASRNNPGTMNLHDESNSRRLTLLLEWWEITHAPEFAAAATSLTRTPPQGFSQWLDAEPLIEIAKSLASRFKNEIPGTEEIRANLERGIIGLLESGIYPDELLAISDAVEDSQGYFSQRVTDAIVHAVDYYLDDVESLSAQVDSESTLDDHLTAITTLASRANVVDGRLRQAVVAIQTRKREIESEVKEEEPEFSGALSGETDKFENEELRNLFKLLLDSASAMRPS